MNLTRILVAVDALQARDAAFERGLALARSSGAELYLLHAVPVDRPFSYRAEERQRRLQAMRTRAEAAGLRVHATEQHGDPVGIIDAHARARAVDLIVIGGEASRRGRRTRSAVAEGVLRRTAVPTLVVMSNAAATASPFRDALIAVDLSPAAENVLGAALDLMGGDARHLTVLHTIKGLEGGDAVHSAARWTVPEYRSYIIGGARRRLEGLLAGVPADVETDVQVTTGPVARAILEQAADGEPDLVVLGRRHGWALFGSTAQRVLRTSDRVLLVIPETAVRRSAPAERRRAA